MSVAAFPELNSTQVRVLEYLYHNSKNKYHLAYPSQERMAEFFGITRRQIRRILDVLEANGYIKAIVRSYCMVIKWAVSLTKKYANNTPNKLPMKFGVSYKQAVKDCKENGKNVPLVRHLCPTIKLLKKNLINRGGETPPLENKVTDNEPTLQRVVSDTKEEKLADTNIKEKMKPFQGIHFGQGEVVVTPKVTTSEVIPETEEAKFLRLKNRYILVACKRDVDPQDEWIYDNLKIGTEWLIAEINRIQKEGLPPPKPTTSLQPGKFRTYAEELKKAIWEDNND